MRNAMHTRAVAGGLPFMTHGAGGGLGGLVVVGMFVSDISVATRASVCRVNGCCQLREIHKDGDFFSRRRCLGKRFVSMAFHAIAVLQGSGRPGIPNRNRQGKQRESQTPEYSSTHTERESNDAAQIALRDLVIARRFLADVLKPRFPPVHSPWRNEWGRNS
jgi:hypothetical protein